MKNRRDKKTKNKAQVEKTINAITKDLIQQFNCNIDHADEALEQLETLCLLLNEANKAETDANEILSTFFRAFPGRKPNSVVTMFIKRDITNSINQKYNLN